MSIVLLADEGLSNEEIAELMPVSAHKAERWRNRFIENGLSGIDMDRPRGGNYGGADPRQHALLRQRIFDKTINKDELPEGSTHWTTRTMAAAIGTNAMFVSRV